MIQALVIEYDNKADKCKAGVMENHKPVDIESLTTEQAGIYFQMAQQVMDKMWSIMLKDEKFRASLQEGENSERENLN